MLCSVANRALQRAKEQFAQDLIDIEIDCLEFGQPLNQQENLKTTLGFDIEDLAKGSNPSNPDSAKDDLFFGGFFVPSSEDDFVPSSDDDK